MFGTKKSYAAHKRFQMIDWVVKDLHASVAERDRTALAHHTAAEKPCFSQPQWNVHNDLNQDDLNLIPYTDLVKAILPVATHVSNASLTRDEIRTVGDDVLNYVSRAMTHAHHQGQMQEVDFLNKLFFRIARTVQFLQWEATGTCNVTYFQPSKAPAPADTTSDEHEADPMSHDNNAGLSIFDSPDNPVQEPQTPSDLKLVPSAQAPTTLGVSDEDLEPVPGMTYFQPEPSPTPA